MMKVSFEAEKVNGKEYILTVFLLGFLSIATQVILLREFLGVFYGNELIIGIVLTNWMILTGAGAYAGKKAGKAGSRVWVILLLLALLSILPFVLVFLMYYLREIVFLPGTMISILEVFLSSFSILFFFCFITGFSFTLLCKLISEYNKKNLVDKVYAWESAGSVVGGILFNLILVWFLDTFESLLFLIVLGLLVLSFVSIRTHQRLLTIILPVLLLGSVIAFIFLKPGLHSKQLLYKNQKVISFQSTPYGNLVITETGEQMNVFENNVLLFSSNQPILSEESVHYPMLQHSDPEKVLLLSAGVPGILKEVLKYEISELDYVEINPWLIRSLQNYSGIYSHDKVRIIHDDAREYLESTEKKYDVVLIGVPEPSTVQLNRFYTREFYKVLKSKLNTGGVVSFSISGSSNYLSEETINLYSSLVETLETSFKNVLLIPGNRNYFVASDRELTYNFAKRAEERGLNNKYVNRYYIQTDLLEKRGEQMSGQLNENVDINKDFEPYTYSLKLRQWLSHFQFNFWVLLVLLLGLGLYFLFYLHPVNRGMFTAGFAGASLELILLVSFQILLGSVFQMVGIIVTVFMAGLAFGAYYRYWLFPKTSVGNYYKVQYILAWYSIIIPLLLFFFKSVNLPAIVVQVSFVILMLIASTLVGMIFSLASGLRLKKPVSIASEIYSVDLLGAALGSFLVSIYLIPLLGLMNVCFIVGGLVGAEALISSYQFKNIRV